MTKTKDMKATAKKAVFIPGWLMILLGIASVAALFTVFVNGWQRSVVAYIVYPVSAYTLTVISVFFFKSIPEHFKKARDMVYDNPLGNRYFTDSDFKTMVSLHFSLGFNLLYSAFKLVAGIYYSSLLLESVAVYYVILSLIRFLILRYMHSDEDAKTAVTEYRRCRLCGILMLVLNFALTAVVVYMSVSDEVGSYPLFVTVISAVYTFYRVAVSVVDVARYRKFDRPVITVSKAIRFAAALVSLLSLEASMLLTFGESASVRRRMTAITGSGICLIVTAMSVAVIVLSGRGLKRCKDADCR